MKSELRWEIKFLKPVMFLLRLGVDKVGHDEWRNNNKERLSNSPQNVGKSFKIKKNKRYLKINRINLNGSVPWEKAPAKAFCSSGDKWYFVVPLKMAILRNGIFWANLKLNHAKGYQ